MMNLSKVIIGICSLLFIMVGADKFFHFLEPPCSLMNSISPMLWKGLGILQMAGGVLIWFSKFRKYVVVFFFFFMLFFSVFHLIRNTYDIGGSAFMAALLGLLMWNPKFLGGGK